ncbi:MAG: hypothetical protein ACRD4B_11005, partial [Acidobacteriota bacterium]
LDTTLNFTFTCRRSCPKSGTEKRFAWRTGRPRYFVIAIRSLVKSWRFGTGNLQFTFAGCRFTSNSAL